MEKRFLFVTANHHETEALLSDKQFFVFEEKRSSIKTDATFYNVGRFGEYDVVHFELINQGSVKADASILAIYEAIEAWNPDAVILVGIAFGKDNDDSSESSQHIGDLLISKMVADYESEKIKEGVHQSDGFISESGRQLTSVCQHYSKSWNHSIEKRKAVATMGLILSGDRVIDDRKFKSRLFYDFPRAIGGEMEGRGAYSACRRKGIDEWIIIKAICDWGVGKAENKERNQVIASESAVSFLKHIFSKSEAFEKLPSMRKKTTELLSKNMNVSGNQAQNMFISENATVNGGVNIGAK